MPKSNAIDKHHKSNAPSKQERGPHPVHANISTGETENGERSGENNAECSSIVTAPDEYAAGIEGNTDENHLESQMPENLINDEEEASEAVHLAVSLMDEIKADLSLSNLDSAIFLFRQVSDDRPTTHPLHTDAMRDLASALGVRFMYTAQKEDRVEFLNLRLRIIETIKLDWETSHNQNNRFVEYEADTDVENTLELAKGMLTDFQKSTPLHDLNTIIFLVQRSLAHISSSPTIRMTALTALVDALYTRFNHMHGAHGSDLEEAMLQNTVACSLQQDEEQTMFNCRQRVLVLRFARFDLTGELVDLQEGVNRSRNGGIEATGTGTDVLELSRIAGELLKRCRTGAGDMDDLNASVGLYKEIMTKVHHGSETYCYIVNNLGVALSTRFGRGGEQSDLDEAISFHRRALDLRRPLHPNRSGSLNNLANALFWRFEQGGQQSDLDEAISLHRQALDLRLPPHPDRSDSLDNLANALSTRFQQFGEQAYFDEAMSLFSTALQYPFQSPSRCLIIARRWTRYTEQTPHSSAVQAYEAALNALSQVAVLSLDIQSRHLALTAGSDGLARDAARCAIRSGNMEKAIEFLEAGRSVFWSQVLSLRSPFDQLRNVAPDGHQIADRLQHIANELELGSHRDVSASLLDNRKRLSIDQEASRLNRLNEEWDSLIQKVRQMNGFEDYLLPARLSSLKAAASVHPVVILIANYDESHCLVMTSATVHHIPLPELGAPILKVLVMMVQTAVSDLPISRSIINATRETMLQLLDDRGISFQSDGEIATSDDLFQLVLAFLWIEVVKPIIDLLDIKKADTMPVMPVMQWCPTGPFTFLPVHAAGIYYEHLGIDCAPDYFISSYTPTIKALLAGPSEPSTERFQMMAVIQSHQLPSTRVELEKIQQYVPADALIQFGIDGSPARVEDVASHLSTVSIVHFACHGTQHPSNPLDSGLKLDDGRLKISRIMKEKMPNGSLTFLCACETAMGDAKLPDEAMSIAASLIFSGFQRVVATMWAMRDEDGPTIADIFYRELFRGPDGELALVPDVTKSARALHTAVQELRSQNVPFRRWVPFIHMGK